MSDLGRTLLTIVGLLGAALTLAAGMIWIERRLLAAFQERLGPNRVGPFGLLQPLADAIKLLFKEDWVPPFADRPVFVIAPALGALTALLALAVVPVAPGIGVAAGADVGLLFVLGMMSLAAWGVVLAGWSSNSKYPLLGGLRSVALLITYEVFMGLSLMGVVVQAGSFDLRAIVAAQEGMWFCIPQAIGFVVFAVAGLAETHRLPFDLPEAESELVAGYHSEYSGMKFGLFFVGEYLGMVLVSALVTVLFLGGWHGPLLPPVVWFGLKMLLVLGGFVLARAALPRPRYDQAIAFGWKVLLPLVLLNLIVTGAIVLATEPSAVAPERPAVPTLLGAGGAP